MGRMKDVFTAICEAFPSSCPHCEAELSGFIDLDKLNKAMDEVAEIARVNAEQQSKAGIVS